MTDIRSRLDVAKGKQQVLSKLLSDEKKALDVANKDSTASITGQIILQESAKLTQEQLEYRVSKLVSLAMESVFDDPYEISLDFVENRGKTGAQISFLKNEHALDPLLDTGGGTVDVAAFGLQISLWTLQNPRTRNLLILDEPLKWLKGGGLPDKGAEMLQQISHKLGLQILMVSHSPELIEHADRVFTVTQNNKISVVKQEK